MNLKQMLAATARSLPNKTAIVSVNGRVSYREVEESSNRIAHALLARGIKRGERVAMLLPNCPEFVYFYFGIAKSGAVPVPLDTRYKIPEIESVFQNCAPVALVTDSSFLAMIIPELHRLKTLKYVVNIDTEYADKCVIYREMVSQSPAGEVDIEPDDRDLGLISYPSGPSSHPKGSAINHHNLCALADASAKSFKQTAEDVVMMFALPMYHNFSLGSLLLTSIFIGSTLVLVPGTGISITSLMEAVERERGTIWLGVPYIFALAIKIAMEEGIKHDLSSLRLCGSGGSTLPMETITRFQHYYGMTIDDVWGLTEAVAHISSQPMDGRPWKLGSCGIPLLGYELKAMDDSGNMLPANQAGEIMVRGPMLDCYYNNPEATAQAITDGWLHTGDLGYLDEDGYLFLTGRKKRMIILKGQNIYPVDIEELLLSHPKIAGVNITGVPDPLRGEIVRAEIHLKDNEVATEQEIKRFCLERAADYKAPREIVFV